MSITARSKECEINPERQMISQTKLKLGVKMTTVHMSGYLNQTMQLGSHHHKAQYQCWYQMLNTISNNMKLH